MGHKALGYTTPLSLLYAVKEWERIHSYTLITLMHIALHTNGGVDHNLAAPHLMLYTLESLSTDGSNHDEHVSKAFRILSARIVHKDDLFCFSQHWEEDLAGRRKRELALWRTFITDPALAGAFPVTFMVEGTGGVHYHFYDVYRPLRHAVDVSPGPRLRLAFDDLALLCNRAVALGIVFDCPDDTTQIYPEAGIYSRVGRKGWKKISKPNIWKDVLEPMMDEHPSDFLSGLPLKLIWALFENW